MVFRSDGKQRFRKEVMIPPLVPTTTTTTTTSSGMITTATTPSSYHPYCDALAVTYTNDVEAAQAWVDLHFGSSSSSSSHSNNQGGPRAMGWDMESAPDLPWRKKSTYHGPATVQLAVVDAAMVLQIAREDTGPYWENLPFLRDILSDPSILKVGVGLDQDMLDLIRWPHDNAEKDDQEEHGGTFSWGAVVGRLDIGGIGGMCGTTKSLKSLAKDVCGVELVKSRKLAMSNWAAANPPQLTNEQIAYAARDAWVAAAVLHELARRDPDQFSTDVLAARVLNEELPIQVLNTNALARKEAKIKWKKLLTDKDGTKIDRKQLTHEQRKVVSELEDIMKDLAPPQPFLFEIDPEI